MSEKVRISFLGGTGTVTGSKFLLRTADKTIMVDCGLFQGLKKLRLLNREKLPLAGEKIDFVLLTHAHIDHSGYLPKLVKDGFRGRIISTAPSLKIAEILLRDSAKISAEEAEKANQEGYSRHHPAEPLYTIEDVEKTIPLFSGINEGEWTELSPGIKVRFNYAGHILGASFIELVIAGKIFVFSGDLGRRDDLLLHQPKKPQRADILFLESTYGDRIHPEAEKDFFKFVREGLRKKGTVIIPCFAVERVQLLLFLLSKYREQNLLSDIPVYLDSPMGNSVLQIFHDFPYWHKLSEKELNNLSRETKINGSLSQTFKTIANNEAKIVLAGSGMATGGRVLLYLQKYLSDPKAMVILAGYQAEGTRGRLLLDGAKEIKIHGKYYPVKAKIRSVQGLSAHADQTGLLDWLKEIKNIPERVFIVHGEAQAADTLRVKIADTYGWSAIVPELNAEEEIVFLGSR